MDKLKLQERKQEILILIKEFCSKKLNNEYYEIAERLVQKLGRKRDVPFVSGQPEIWAAAIIHAIGTINFLFDKSSEPYVTIDEINVFFGTKKSTTGNKSTQIRVLLNLAYFDKEFSTGEVLKNSPYNDLVLVDGFIVSIDTLPEEYQQLVRKARAEGNDITLTTE